MAVLVAMGLCTSWCILHSQTSLICLALLFIGLRCLFDLYAKYYHSSGVYAAAAADGHWERGHFNRNVHRWNNHLGHWIWIKLDINGIANCINLNGLLYCAHSLAHLPNANKNHQLLNSQSDTNPMPIHNKYSIFNKQTNSCAQIFHTHENTQHTYTEMLMHSSTLGWFVCLHFHMFVGAVAVLFSLHMHFGILDWCVWKRWQSERKEANNLPIETLIDTFIRYLLWVFDGISPLAVAIHDFFSLCDLFTTFNRIQYSTLMYFTRAFWPFHTVIVDG